MIRKFLDLLANLLVCIDDAFDVWNCCDEPDWDEFNGVGAAGFESGWECQNCGGVKR